MAETRLERIQKVTVAMDNEFASFKPQYRDLGDYIVPTRTRFTLSDTNRGDRRNLKIIDATATLASRTLRSGFVAGMTSPARPWFRVTLDDTKLAEYGPVKIWLDGVTKIMSSFFLRSNLYSLLPVVYGDMGDFALGSLFVEEDFENVMHSYSFPIGSYRIANDDKLRVRVFYREFKMTVRQIVRKFGKLSSDGSSLPDWSNISLPVRTCWERGEYEAWFNVKHIVKQNESRDDSRILSKFKPYSSLYYESSTPGEDDRFLSEKGYSYFPLLAPRWEVAGEDVYGTSCPGMIALGYIKALQTMQKRKAQAVEKSLNPPMTGPTALKGKRSSILPGDITYVDSQNESQRFRPAHEVSPQTEAILLDIQDHRTMIRRAYYEDLFLMLAQSEDVQRTAREIDERHEEKLLALGPVLEQTDQDLLDPLIDIGFNLGIAQEKFPPPPPEIQGKRLKIEYVSIMAQAQKLAGIANIERFTSFVVNLAATSGISEVLDKADLDQTVDVYGERLGVDAELIRDDDAVAVIRERRLQQQQQQQTMNALDQAADTVQKLSKADLEKDNLMKRMVNV